MSGFDYVPPGKEVVGGKLVPKRADPYIQIEQQRQRIAQLEQKIVNGESAQLIVACDELRRKNGDLDRQVTEHLTAIKGRDGTIAEMAAKIDDLTRANSDLQAQLESAKRLPEVTPEVEALAAANRRIDELSQDNREKGDKIESLLAQLAEIKPAAKRRSGQ